MNSHAVAVASGVDDILGMHSVKKRVSDTVLLPLQSAALGDPAVAAPHGLLVYGPRGCGVSFVAEMVARDAERVGAKVMSKTDPLDAANAGVFRQEFECDSTPSRRELRVAYCHEPWDLTPEGLEDLGLDRMVFVAPPDWEARQFRVWQELARYSADDAEISAVVEATQGWTGVDIAECLKEYDPRVGPESLDLDRTPSADTWLERAQSLMARFETTRMVDDLESYLLRIRARQ